MTTLAAKRAEKDRGCESSPDGLASIISSAFVIEDTSVGSVSHHVGGDHGLVGRTPESRQRGLEGVHRPSDVTRLDQMLGLGASVPALPEVAHEAREQPQHAARPLEVRMASPARVECIDQQRMKRIGAFKQLSIGTFRGLGRHLARVGRVHLLIDLGDPLRVVRPCLRRARRGSQVALRSDRLEQAGPDDLVDLFVRDRFDIGPEAPEALLQRHEGLLSLLALRDLVLARRERSDHHRARDLLNCLGQLLHEGDGLIRKVRIADRHRRRANAVISQFIQQDQTRRRGLQDLEEQPLRHPLALVVRTHALVEGLSA